MRRLIASLVALLAVLPSGRATAAASTLLVNTLGRTGQLVTSNPFAVNLSTQQIYYLTSGHAQAVPAGTYDVLVNIVESSGAESLGAVRVKVSGTTATTIDARRGRLVSVSLVPAAPSGLMHTIGANLCDGDITQSATANTDAGHVYVIPSSVSSLEVAFTSAWTPYPTAPAGSSYAEFLTAGVRKGGIPSGISSTVSRTSLAIVRLSARSGPESGSASIQFNGGTADPCQAPVRVFGLTEALPFTVTSYVAPGSWGVSEDAQDTIADDEHSYAAGKTYSLAFNHAAWGPDHQLPYMFFHQMHLNDTDMFADPALPSHPSFDAQASTAYTLTLGTHTVWSRTVLSFPGYQIINIPGAGWYTLSARATRHPVHTLPAGVLSPKVTLAMRFYANPAVDQQIRDYLVRMIPEGLDTENRAAPKAHTTVVFRATRDKPFDSVVQNADAVKSLRVWYSPNGGSSWVWLAVTAHTGSWTVSVPDPASGAVSLRAQIIDTHGDSSTTTIYRAYSIS